MPDNEYKVVAAIYPTEDGAKKMLDQLVQMKKDDIIHIVDAATMWNRNPLSGKAEFDSPASQGAPRWLPAPDLLIP